MYKDKLEDPFVNKVNNIKTKMRQPGRVASCLKCGILVVLLWFCGYVYIATQKAELFKKLRSNTNTIDIADLPVKISDLVARGFNRDNEDQANRAERVFQDAQPTRPTFEVDEGITREAYKFIKVFYNCNSSETS